MVIEEAIVKDVDAINCTLQCTTSISNVFFTSFLLIIQEDTWPSDEMEKKFNSFARSSSYTEYSIKSINIFKSATESEWADEMKLKLKKC